MGGGFCILKEIKQRETRGGRNGALKNTNAKTTKVFKQKRTSAEKRSLKRARKTKGCGVLPLHEKLPLLRCHVVL